jgi:hypothetical protein
MGRRGPKPKSSSEYSSDGANLSARITAGTRKRLEEAAQASGQSISKELENRLVRSFENDKVFELFGGRPSYARLRLLAEAIKGVEELTGQRWHRDRFTHDLVIEMIRLMLEALAPTGKGDPPASFPTFIKGSPLLQAAFRETALRSLKINREDFLTEVVSFIVNGALERLEKAQENPAEAGDPYRGLATDLPSLKKLGASR